MTAKVIQLYRGDPHERPPRPGFVLEDEGGCDCERRTCDLCGTVVQQGEVLTVGPAMRGRTPDDGLDPDVCPFYDMLAPDGGCLGLMCVPEGEYRPDGEHDCARFLGSDYLGDDDDL